MKQLYTLMFVCLSMGVFAQPGNDNCANAIAIGDASDLEFTTVDATTDGPFHPDSPCPSSSDLDSIYSDIWYAYTPGYTGNCFWTICGTANFDTKIAVYNPGSTCPPADGDLLTCNEDGGNCSFFTSELLFQVVEGQTYLLRLGGFGEDTPGEQGTGTFSISEFVPVQPNDFCSDAIAIDLGEDQAIVTTGATTDGPDHPNDPGCFGFGDITVQSDVWYTFTPNFTGTVEWSTCETVSFDSRLAVYGPNVMCPVEDGDLYDCNDDGAGCASYTSKLIFDVEAGNTYLLRIGGYDGETGSGTFNLVTTETPIPPDNDLCADAESITVTDPGGVEEVTGTTINATYDNDNFIFPLCLPNQSGGEFAEVWYTFNSGGDEMLELLFAGLTAQASFLIDIWTECGSGPIDTLAVPGSCFSYDSETGSIQIDTIGPLPAETLDYVMRVTTRLTSELPGDFVFQLNRMNVSSTKGASEVFREVLVAPNPTSDFLNISFSLERPTSLSWKIFDGTGRLVDSYQTNDLFDGSKSLTLDVHDFSKGMYVMQIQATSGESYILKFVKS